MIKYDLNVIIYKENKWEMGNEKLLYKTEVYNIVVSRSTCSSNVDYYDEVISKYWYYEYYIEMSNILYSNTT